MPSFRSGVARRAGSGARTQATPNTSDESRTWVGVVDMNAQFNRPTEARTGRVGLLTGARRVPRFAEYTRCIDGPSGLEDNDDLAAGEPFTGPPQSRARHRPRRSGGRGPARNGPRRTVLGGGAI